MVTDKGISLVVPVYNESKIIQETLLDFIRKISFITDDFEIIVVDDGSTDETARIIRGLCEIYSNIKLIENQRNIGSGGSLWKGMRVASKELVVSNFADSPFDLSDLRKVLPLFCTGQTDFVIVTRKDRSANTAYRKLTSYANYALIRFLFNARIRDFQFVQVYKRSILKDIQILSSGTFVPPEIMLRLIHRKYSYDQIESVFHKRSKGRSKCGRPREVLKTVREIIVFRILTFMRIVRL